MIWLTWRQHRIELLLTLGLALGLAAAITVLTYLIQTDQATAGGFCSTNAGPLCQQALNSGLDPYSEIALLVLPGLAGVFIGAPLLAREFEQGTIRLVWTQGIGRLRWLGVKLALILGIASIAGAALGIAGARLVWSQEGIFSQRWYAFDIQGPAYVGHVIFAIALGVAVGALIRRTVPAMAATLVVFVAIRVAVYNWVRPNYLPPLEASYSAPLDLSNSWNLGSRAVDLSGHTISQQYVDQLWANAGNLTGSVDDYFRAHGVILLQVYQPESRFWLFQSIEAGMFVVLAAILLGVAMWSIRRA